jgi:ankyrin repeat protein
MNIKLLTAAMAIGLIGWSVRSEDSGIHDAAATGNIELLKKYLAEDPQLISARSGRGWTPLCVAAMCGQVKAVEFLIESGADVNGRSSEAMTPLTNLAAKGITNDDRCAVIATILLAHGADVDLPDCWTGTPLMHAVETRKSLLAHVLLGYGAKADRLYNGLGVNAGKTPLWMAIYNRDKDMVAALLEFGAPFDGSGKNWRRAGYMAEAENEPDIAALIHNAEAQAAQAPPRAYSPVPSPDEMRALAACIAEGDDLAFKKLNSTADRLYGEIKNYQDERDRVLLLLGRMHAAFDLLGEEAGKGNGRALQALKKCLDPNCRLQSFAPDALGIAAAAGNKEALDILIHYNDWGILQSSAVSALCAPAKANVEPAVEYFVNWLATLQSDERDGGMAIAATNALGSAAAMGNPKAKAALEKFTAAAAPPGN